MPDTRPERQRILDTMSAFRPACVIGAAAELDLWTVLAQQPQTADELAGRLGANLRALTMLLDAVVAMGLLEKHDWRYNVPAELRDWLVADGCDTILPMLQHAACIARGWAQLAAVVKQGAPAPRQPSIRGAEADRAAFIGAMHSVSGPAADGLVAQLAPLEISPSARRRRGVGHVDAGLSPGRANGHGHDLRLARRY